MRNPCVHEWEMSSGDVNVHRETGFILLDNMGRGLLLYGSKL